MARSIVLVHGAWHGAWCWYRVVPELRALGLNVVTPDLPGHGIDRSPVGACTLESYVARVVAAIDALDAPVILVGHSLAGLVISQVAEVRAPRIARLVYVAAFLPRDGDSANSLAPIDPASELARGSAFVAGGAAAAVGPATAADVFYHDCPAADIALAERLLVPEPLAPILAPVRLADPGAGRLPRTFIECTNDRVIPLDSQRRMQAARPCGRVAGLATGHSPFFAAPAALAALLARA